MGEIQQVTHFDPALTRREPESLDNRNPVHSFVRVNDYITIRDYEAFNSNQVGINYLLQENQMHATQVFPPQRLPQNNLMPRKRALNENVALRFEINDASN